MKLEKLFLRKDLPINIAVVIIAVIVCISMVNSHNEQSNKLIKDRENQVEKNKLLQDVQSITEKLNSIDDNFWEIDADLSKAIAAQLKLKLTQLNAEDIKITSQKQEDEKFYILNPATLEFVLDYKGLLSFLRYIDNHTKMFRVHKLDVAKLTEESKYIEDKLEVKILLSAYSFKE